MSNRVLAFSATALVAGLVSFTTAAGALPVADGLAIKNSAASNIENVQFRGFGFGLGAGLLGGAIIGGALAAPYYRPYYYAPGYYPPAYYPAPVYGGPPVYGAPGYAGPPAYAGPPPGGDAAGYCARKYRSFDPASGTFLGLDGVRHPCP